MNVVYTICKNPATMMTTVFRNQTMSKKMTALSLPQSMYLFWWSEAGSPGNTCEPWYQTPRDTGVQSNALPFHIFKDMLPGWMAVLFSCSLSPRCYIGPPPLWDWGSWKLMGINLYVHMIWLSNKILTGWSMGACERICSCCLAFDRLLSQWFRCV